MLPNYVKCDIGKTCMLAIILDQRHLRYHRLVQTFSLSSEGVYSKISVGIELSS